MPKRISVIRDFLKQNAKLACFFSHQIVFSLNGSSTRFLLAQKMFIKGI